MQSTIGKKLILSIAGGSHEPELQMTLAGLPAGISIDFDQLQQFLKRRAPGNSPYTTPRKEEDVPLFLQGFSGSITDGSPIRAVIKNTNIRPGDYRLEVPRPGHADLMAHLKYQDRLNMSGGGPFSGRMTAPMCVAGGIALQILEKEGIRTEARIVSIGPKKAGPHMMDEILKAKEDNDSVGGVVECRVTGLPAGIGGPMFDGVESQLAALLFGIPAVRGVEFGAGFQAASMRGSQHNDEFFVHGDHIRTRTNNHGGILGGITSGMPLILRVAFKPTPSIGISQNSVNLRTMENTTLSTVGRHDPCVVPRGVPVVEGLVAFGLLDLMMLEEEPA
jgi:chorismate synthase